MIRILLLLAGLLLPGPTLAGDFTAYGPVEFQRMRGTPAAETRSFDVLNPQTSYTLRVINGGMTRRPRLVSDATIWINGVEVVSESEFNQQISIIEKPITLLAVNEIAVYLEGSPNSAITIEIIGVDNDLPSIVSRVTPEPNANGWNNSDLVISFECFDGTSGIAACSGPVTVTTEGAGQDVTGTALDVAGGIPSPRV